MKTNRIYTLLILLTGVMVLNSSCRKWMDVRTDPNNPSDEQMTLELVLPSAEYNISYVVGNRYAEIGGFLSQYWTQLPSATQYYDYDRYSFDATDADREWSQLYAGSLKDLSFIVAKGATTGDSNYVAVAKILQAYTYQLISDVHGDIPFTEALMAQGGTIAPHYDAQSVVYDGCENLLNEAMDWMSPESAKHPGADDVIFGGDMAMWIKFANTLKLKLAMRQSGIRPANAAAIMATLSTADFLESGEMAEIHFFDVTGNKNPLYASIQGIGVDNNVASKAIADTLNGWADPRAIAFFDESSFGAAGINGTVQGIAAYNPGAYPSNSPRSTLSSQILGPTVPVIFMSAWESNFLQAEAKAQGWLTGASTAQEDYEEAIVSNMEYYGFDTTGLSLFAAAPYAWEANLADQLKQIGVQKWVAFCGNQNIESWIEWRRTGYPVLEPSKASTLPLGLFPARIPYPSGEETANPNFPGQKPITEKMWWDL
ncbi:MAG: SusD/RagB family nutrient-binding outer membrane lipoprotein [Chitinophagaceae bacterium]|nr:SusD/RagB family nutrient-binding outer membrane lipoprotein [Chitinophagaceae bacterium]